MSIKQTQNTKQGAITHKLKKHQYLCNYLAYRLDYNDFI